jgi:predicted acetyltransferase
MNTVISPATLNDKSLIQRLMELYQYDFSETEGNDLDQHGYFGYSYLDYYWVEKGRHPFLVHVNGKIAGFVLVNNRTYVQGNNLSIAEFFIMRKYRKQGIGKIVAFQVFDRFLEKWEIQETETNIGAQQFWRKVVAAYTDGQYTEVIMNDEHWKGPVQFFDNTSR